MEQAEYMKMCSQKWNALSDGEKDTFKREAKDIRAHPEKNFSREQLITYHTKAICRSVSNIHNIAKHEANLKK